MSAKRPLSWQTALFLPFAAGFVGTSFSLMVSSVQASENTSLAGTTTPVVGSGAGVEAAGRPVQLYIPAIGVNANVESVNLSKTGNGTLGIPSNFVNVAWYNQGPSPGNPGIAIIDGHLDGRYVPQAVFYRLNELTNGSSIYVKDELGTVRRFVVTGSQQIAANADTSALFSNSGPSRLVFITCAGDWLPNQHQYTDREVVFASLVN